MPLFWLLTGLAGAHRPEAYATGWTVSDVIEITTTCESETAAHRLAEQLLEKRLAACVQIAGPVFSVYRWQGTLHREPEWTCTIKSLHRLKDRLIEFLTVHHGYEVPQILIAVVEASDSYRRWVASEVEPEQVDSDS